MRTSPELVLPLIMVAVAGTLPPGPAQAAPGGQFQVILDPGAHLIVLSRPGYAEAVVSERMESPGGPTAPIRPPGKKKSQRHPAQAVPVTIRPHD